MRHLTITRRFTSSHNHRLAVIMQTSVNRSQIPLLQKHNSHQRLSSTNRQRLRNTQSQHHKRNRRISNNTRHLRILLILSPRTLLLISSSRTRFLRPRLQHRRTVNTSSSISNTVNRPLRSNTHLNINLRSQRNHRLRQRKTMTLTRNQRILLRGRDHQRRCHGLNTILRNLRNYSRHSLNLTMASITTSRPIRQRQLFRINLSLISTNRLVNHLSMQRNILRFILPQNIKARHSTLH